MPGFNPQEVSNLHNHTTRHDNLRLPAVTHRATHNLCQELDLQLRLVNDPVTSQDTGSPHRSSTREIQSRNINDQDKPDSIHIQVSRDPILLKVLLSNTTRGRGNQHRTV